MNAHLHYVVMVMKSWGFGGSAALGGALWLKTRAWKGLCWDDSKLRNLRVKAGSIPVRQEPGQCHHLSGSL